MAVCSGWFLDCLLECDGVVSLTSSAVSKKCCLLLGIITLDFTLPDTVLLYYVFRMTLKMNSICFS
jgi:hypothetical protein